MGRGSETDHLRREIDHPIVLVVSLMMQGDSNRH